MIRMHDIVKKGTPAIERWRDRTLGTGYFFLILAWTQASILYLLAALFCSSGAALAEAFVQEKARDQSEIKFN